MLTEILALAAITSVVAITTIPSATSNRILRIIVPASIPDSRFPTAGPAPIPVPGTRYPVPGSR